MDEITRPRLRTSLPRKTPANPPGQWSEALTYWVRGTAPMVLSITAWLMVTPCLSRSALM